MQQASRWRESITQEPYDLKFLNLMASAMDIRQELWMYVEVSMHAIKEWKTLLFKKVCKVFNKLALKAFVSPVVLVVSVVLTARIYVVSGIVRKR